MIVELNTKSDFTELVNGADSGINRSYLLKDVFDNKIDKIVYASNILKDKNKVTPFIEVKYNFGRRNKRLEIVFIDSLGYNLCKITNASEFDKDYFDLLLIIKDIESHFLDKNIHVNGMLIFLSEYNSEVVEDFLRKQQKYFRHTYLSNT